MVIKGEHVCWLLLSLAKLPFPCHVPELHAMMPPNLAEELSPSCDVRFQLLFEAVLEMRDPLNPWGNFAVVCFPKPL